MNTAYFISKKLFKRKKGSFSSIVSNVAIVSITLGIAILISAYSILQGFNFTIQEKIFGFAGHLEITKFGADESFQEVPLETDTYIRRHALELKGVASLSTFAKKPALIQSDEGVQGIILKGIDKSYDLVKTTALLEEGRMIQFSDTAQVKEIVISRTLANKMKLKLGDRAVLFFVQDPPRLRKLEIVGIYNSDLEEFDAQITFGDIKLVQKLNGWGDTLVGGYEINVKDFSKLDEVALLVYENMDYNLSLVKVSDVYYQLFDWFKLLETNINVLLAAILAVVLLNLGSSFTIIILERTNLIGTLKALGAESFMIQKIFFTQGFKMLMWGLILGNGIGIGFCYLQKTFNIIPLDAKNYYMEYVPIEMDWNAIIGINIVNMAAVLIALFVPTLFISFIQPIKSIKFD